VKIATAKVAKSRKEMPSFAHLGVLRGKIFMVIGAGSPLGAAWGLF